MTGGEAREYHPESRFDDGLLQAARHILAELRQHRSHIKTLFQQEFRSSYAGTFLGVFWNIFLPLLPVTVYVLLAAMRVVPEFAHVPSTLAITLNVTLWYLFSACVSMPIATVKGRNAEAMKTSLPLSTALVAGFARTLFETLVRLVLVFVAAVVLLHAPAQTAPLALLAAGLGCALFFAIGLVASLVNIVVPDVQRVVTALLQYGVFLSGVIFPLPQHPAVGWLQWANPFHVFIQATRELLFIGWPSNALALGVWSAIAVGGLLIAVRVFYVMEHRIRGVL